MHHLHFYVNMYSVLQIKELDPYIYFYCQNNLLRKKKASEMMGSLMDRGEVVKLDNKGRESKPSSFHLSADCAV